MMVVCVWCMCEAGIDRKALSSYEPTKRWMQRVYKEKLNIDLAVCLKEKKSRWITTEMKTATQKQMTFNFN